MSGCRTNHILALTVSLALVTAVAHTTSGADEATPQDLSALLAPIVSRHEVPGMVAAIVEGENTVAWGASGVRRKGKSQPISRADKFHIGSCTKSMTASLCAMLVAEKRLSWDSTLKDVFPDVKMRPEYRAIRLEQLLTNHSGMTNHLNQNGLWPRLWKHQGQAMDARRLLLEGVVELPLEASPGERFIYSNAGFAIAGHMAEKTTGTSWEKLLQRRLFRPLNMTTAGFGAPGTKGKLDQPLGHTEQGKPVEPGPGSDNPVAIGPAGTVHCSIEDWGKYIAWHLRGAQGTAKLLEANSFKKLHTPLPGTPQYAMGWVVTKRTWAGGRVLTHSGSNTMWFAVAWLAPGRNFAVLVACNQGGTAAEKACDEAASRLIAHYQTKVGR